MTDTDTDSRVLVSDCNRQIAEVRVLYMDERLYVSVVADYMPDGTMKPVSLRFPDGRAFEITRIDGVIHTSMTKQHGAETRYYIKIGGGGHYLFFEDTQRGRAPRWFVKDC